MKADNLLSMIVACFATLIVTLFLVDIRSVYEPTVLLPVLNTLFLSIIPCFAAYTAARLFLSVGKISLLFVGCALLALGLGGFVSGWLIGSAGGPNAAITVYNSGTLICALLLLTGKIFISLKTPFRTHDQRVRFLIFSYFCVAIIFSGIVAAVATGNTPLFILQGVGPTLLGKSVLITSIFCFCASAAVCSRQYNISGVKLFRWYATGLILLAIGLTGVLLQKYVGSPIGWAGRFSQYIGAACILAGLLDFWRTKSDTGQPLEVIFDTLSQKRIGELEHLNIELEQMISEQQSAEEALRVSEDRYRNLLGRVPAIIYNYSVRQGGLFYSPQVEQVFGYPLQEFYDNPLLWKESIHPDDVGTVECAISQLIKGGDKIDIEYRVRNRSGEWLWLLDSLVQRKEINGDVVIYGIAQNITQRKQMDVALRESDERFRLGFENANIGMCLVDTNGRLLLVNRQMSEMFGYSKSELESMHVNDIAHPDDFGVSTAFINKAKTGETDHSEFEKAYVHKQGRLIMGHVSSSLVRNVNGEPMYFISHVMDITERKKLEKELKAKNAELESFTYTVSHDLKSPLITVQYFTGQIKQDLSAGRNENVTDDLDKITAAVTKMTGLLDDLLKLSRVGRIVNAPVQIDMGLIVREVIAQLAGTISRQQVEIVVQPGLPVVYGDQQRIAEVMQNLVENALKYLGTCTQPKIEIGVRRSDKSDIFFIRDNGIGIDPLYRDKIFGLFQKLDANSEGSGMGLALVRRIIEVQGGRVWVESEGVGLGSTFCFTLPSV